ncbi:MAG: outer membrane lipoprotein carrier protein LolA [Rickettsiales bacterium]|jgi:outer membrane lipoprotein-sorting protein|nr:outer membrane lipoprotein carrier protein LolA [Rickettsiales bacterium]
MKVFLLYFIVFVNFGLATEIVEIERYFKSLKTFEANFIQDDVAGGLLSEGVIYLSRPGKLRVDYKVPFEAQIFTIDNVTIYYDKELDEISNIPTSTTPLYFLLKGKIDFNDLIVKKIKENDDEITLSMQDKKNKEQGILYLTFSKSVIELKSIRTKNELGQEVQMELLNITSNKGIKESVFEFINPRLKNKI